MNLDKEKKLQNVNNTINFKFWIIKILYLKFTYFIYAFKHNLNM